LEFANEHDMLPKKGSVLVCVSGGADSMCLLEVMRHISYEYGFEIAAVHYNHRLRGEESDRDETFVMNVCQTHGIPFYSAGSDVAGYAKRHGIGIEEAARDIRYGFFRETAEKIGAERIATAHTKNDNTETMLMNFVRGTGANGMAGIPPVRDEVIRPLLGVTRKQVMEFLTVRGISYMEDSTNSLDIYTRNKIRINVIPQLESINPRLNEAAFAASQLFREDEEFISDIADLFIKDCCMGLTANAADLAILPFSVSSRVIRKLYEQGSLSHKHVRDILDLCANENPSAQISLPGMTVYREYDRIIFDPEQMPGDSQFAPVYPKDGDNITIFMLGLDISCKTVIYDEKRLFENGDGNVYKPFTLFLFKSIDICGKITVRPRKEGDLIKLKGTGGTKTLKKLFIERKIPTRKRALVPVICDDEGVLGVYGIGISQRAVPKQGDSAVLISFKETDKSASAHNARKN